jgi:peroxiredoxin
MSELLKPGDTAPPFNLPDQSDNEVSCRASGAARLDK